MFSKFKWHNRCLKAAILADGSVVTWGLKNYGGSSSEVHDRLRNVHHHHSKMNIPQPIVDCGMFSRFAVPAMLLLQFWHTIHSSTMDPSWLWDPWLPEARLAPLRPGAFWIPKILFDFPDKMETALL